MLKYYDSVILAGTIVIIISFFLSFINRNKENNPKVLKHFYLYNLMVCLLSLNTVVYYYTAFQTHQTLIRIEEIISLCDYLFWIIFFYNLNRKDSKFSKYFILPIFFIGTIIIITLNTYDVNRFVGIGIANLTKCLFCLYYFYKLSTTLPLTKLKVDPIFWVIVGLFFHTTVIIPINISTAFINTLKSQEMRNLLLSFTNLSILIMHLGFIKSQFCIMKQKNINERMNLG